MASRQLLVSVHDVMPRTLDNTEQIVRRLRDAGMTTVTLLVVPDTGWDREALLRLTALVSEGAEIAGHGWCHSVDRIRGIRHRLHSLLISRDVAEHLALTRSEAVELMRRCHAWFGEHGLPAPDLYVPPAWAMGNVTNAELDSLPFSQFETMNGVYDNQQKRFRRYAMIGFEADTAFRAFACRAWNRLNLMAAGTSKPIRVAIHPQDFDLRLGHDLRALFDQGGMALSYTDIQKT